MLHTFGVKVLAFSRAISEHWHQDLQKGSLGRAGLLPCVFDFQVRKA